ncbi:hypothetical protein GCM10007877_14550 [Marinibactrum halimedae]|uniref:Uncharacterized protein n=1 Tax=Marinibactrum halimedae TaxID=1444977 RepID=A0AA37T553_9GAMM|nr:hypothetical protein GCM10007877_14550 [Marinibactrum halimedae]
MTGNSMNSDNYRAISQIQQGIIFFENNGYFKAGHTIKNSVSAVKYSYYIRECLCLLPNV